jgi:hypothetical protein
MYGAKIVGVGKRDLVTSLAVRWISILQVTVAVCGMLNEGGFLNRWSFRNNACGGTILADCPSVRTEINYSARL